MPLTAAEQASLPLLSPTPDAATAVLTQLKEADRIRSDLAREESVWALERARLQALIDATAAETTRLERDATQAEQQRDQARIRLAALGSGSDLDAVRQQLADGGARASSALAAVARQRVPGAVPAPVAATGDGVFDAIVRALESAEQGASSVAVEVITGQRNGQTQAVKVLRIAGAAAWWVALDGAASGIVTVDAGVVRLLDASNAQTGQAIAMALAQAEGRQPPGVLLLPAPPLRGDTL